MTTLTVERTSDVKDLEERRRKLAADVEQADRDVAQIEQTLRATIAADVLDPEDRSAEIAGIEDMLSEAKRRRDRAQAGAQGIDERIEAAQLELEDLMVEEGIAERTAIWQEQEQLIEAFRLAAWRLVCAQARISENKSRLTVLDRSLRRKLGADTPRSEGISWFKRNGVNHQASPFLEFQASWLADGQGRKGQAANALFTKWGLEIPKEDQRDG